MPQWFSDCSALLLVRTLETVSLFSVPHRCGLKGLSRGIQRKYKDPGSFLIHFVIHAFVRHLRNISHMSGIVLELGYREDCQHLSRGACSPEGRQSCVRVCMSVYVYGQSMHVCVHACVHMCMALLVRVCVKEHVIA